MYGARGKRATPSTDRVRASSRTTKRRSKENEQPARRWRVERRRRRPERGLGARRAPAATRPARAIRLDRPRAMCDRVRRGFRLVRAGAPRARCIAGAGRGDCDAPTGARSRALRSRGASRAPRPRGEPSAPPEPPAVAVAPAPPEPPAVVAAPSPAPRPAAALGAAATPRPSPHPYAVAVGPGQSPSPLLILLRRLPHPRRAACPSSSGRDGFLNINSLPASLVLLDGKPIGSTPKVHVEVTAGVHRVVFTNSELGVMKEVSVTVGPERNDCPSRGCATESARQESARRSTRRSFSTPSDDNRSFQRPGCYACWNSGAARFSAPWNETMKLKTGIKAGPGGGGCPVCESA